MRHARRTAVGALTLAVTAWWAAGQTVPPPSPMTRPADKGVVYLAAPRPFPNEYQTTLLSRELARQAVLIAARDELGLFTRDQLLDEWPADKPAAAVAVDCHWDAGHGQEAVNVYAETADGRPRLGVDRLALPLDATHWPDVARVASLVEPYSRGRDVALLRQAGYDGHVPPAGTAPLSADVEALLYHTTLLAPVAAVQRTHAAIRATGESPARLSGLVRGYANLALLTGFQWATTQKAFTARSLLYAERLVHSAPDAAASYEARAYAYALAGLTKAAVADLDAAEKRRAAAAGGPTRPDDWVVLVRPYCTRDADRLDALGRSQGPTAALATLLAFVDVQSSGSLARLMARGTAALAAEPGCFRVLDGMAEHAGVAAGHDLTVRGPAVLAAGLADDVALLTGVPNAAALAAGDDPVRYVDGITRSLCDDAASAAEPSSALAGHLLRETAFVQTLRRAEFLAEHFGDAEATATFLDQTDRLVADHPLRNFVRQYKVTQGDARTALLGGTEVPDPQVQMRVPLQQAGLVGKVKGRVAGETAYNRIWSDLDGQGLGFEGDRLPRPFDEDYYTYDLPGPLAYAKQVLAVDPYAPAAVATIARLDWDHLPAGQADRWVEQFGRQPQVLTAVGLKYAEQKAWAKAEPLLARAADLEPDRPSLERLAGFYLDRGDEDRWLATLQRVLDQPDFALDHSWVEKEIAWHYMDEGRYDKGRPWADRSMDDSGSSWSMECAAWAAEFDRDYDRAESIRRAENDRYGGCGWYLWCVRTGRGDVAGARKAADKWVAGDAKASGSYSAVEAGNVVLYEGRPAEARTWYELAMRDRLDAFAGMQAAAVCDDLHDPAGRRADLQFVVDHCLKSKDGNEYAALVETAKLMLAAGDGLPAKDDVNRLIAATDSAGLVSDILYYRGKQMRVAGRDDVARKNFRAVVNETGQVNLWVYTLAADELHRLGEKTEVVRIDPATKRPTTRP